MFKDLFRDKVNQVKLLDAKKTIKEEKLFDYEYYANTYPEVADVGMDLLDHYLQLGYKEGKNPSDSFDTKYYLKMNGDVRVSGVNPLVHYVLYGRKEDRLCTPKLEVDNLENIRQLILDNDLFDEEYYLKQCPELAGTGLDPLTHYLLVGADDGLNPSEDFDTVYYKYNYEDLIEDELNPLAHYVLYGMDKELSTSYDLTDDEVAECISIIDNSNTFDDDYYLSQSPELEDQAIDLITHYVTTGYKNGKNPCRTFDTLLYLEYNPDVRAHAPNPYVHYLTRGRKEGRTSLMTKKMQRARDEQKLQLEKNIQLIRESGLFDEDYYLRKYPSVKYSLTDPIEHYLTRGAAESKNPSPNFNTNFYLYSNEDVDIDEINPLVHYITKGIKSGRSNTTKFMSDDDKKFYEDRIYDDVKGFEYTRYSKQDAPMVSIIMLNRNGSEHLRRLFKTFKKNTDYPNYEIIIIDNASDDDSFKVIDKYSRQLPITLIKNKVNRNFSEANNQGVEVARGEYLLFLNNDTEVLTGWLNHLMDTALSSQDVGAVGSRLVYPDCSTSEYNKHKSYTIQHAGIVFSQSENYIRPYNKDNGLTYDTSTTSTEQRLAVTAASLLVEKSKYDEVEGFDNDYNYGFEDVDLCLKLYNRGYKNYYNPKSVLFHYEFGTQESNEKTMVSKRRINNREIFTKKWNTWLKQMLLMDKLEQKNLVTDDKLKIALAVTEKGADAQAGDYFTALGLSDQLNKLGFETEFLDLRSENPDEDWYKVDKDVDILVSLLDRYDINKIESENPLLVKVAWVRNWIERWVESDYFEDFDLILASSKRTAEYIRQNTGFNPTIFPIASDTSMFNDSTPENEDMKCDYCFTGSYWNAHREIIDYLYPDDLDYTFNLYGANWNRISHLAAYHRGFVNYRELPELYASTKLVIDDANHVTKEYGSVNSRVFDSLAAGRLVITNGSRGNDELFGGQLPEYHSRKDLEDEITYYMENPDKREEKVKKLQKIVLENHTYEIRANKFIDILKAYVSSRRIIIKAPIPRKADKYEWGDYYFAVNLQREFAKLGYNSKIQLLDNWDDLCDGLYDVVLVLRGLSVYEPKSIHYNVMWNISHPDEISFKEYESYDKLYIASHYWAEKIKPLVTVSTDSLIQCTDNKLFTPCYDEKYDTELLFVGNSRLVYRKILKDLLPTDYELRVYGTKWDGLIDEKYWVAEHIDNKDLYKAYSSTKVLLNDHWDDMREKGFISNRIFDAVACGTVVVTDHVRGIEDVFGDAVVYYDEPSQLDGKIGEALNKSSVDPSLVREHTFEARARKIVEDCNQYYDNLMKF